MLEGKGMGSVEQHRSIGELPEETFQEMLYSKGMLSQEMQMAKK